MPYPAEIEEQMKRLYKSLNEKDRRRYAAIEAVKLGWGGMTYISQLLGCDYYVLKLGKEELQDSEAMEMIGIRHEGGGRKSALVTIEGIDEAFIEQWRTTNQPLPQQDPDRSKAHRLDCSFLNYSTKLLSGQDFMIESVRAAFVATILEIDINLITS
jgi:hypothetical protein